MDLSLAQFVGLSISSGGAAGLANQIFRFVHDLIADKRQTASQARELEHQRALQRDELAHQQTAQDRDLAHQRDLQREERAHQAEVRREAAFFEGRRELLPKVVAVYEWIQWWWGDLYGAEVDYHPVSINPPTVVKTPADAITSLAEVAGQHPSRDVRIYARDLYNSIDGTVNMPDHYGDSDPSVEQLANWSKRVSELIDGLHDPDYEPRTIARNGDG